MKTTPLHHRLAITAVIAVFATILPVTFVSAEEDASCLKSAISERSKSIKKAYDEYAKEMIRLSDRMGKDETDSLSGDANSRQYTIARSYSNFAYDSFRAGQDLVVKIGQAWNIYMNKRAGCGYGGGGNYAPGGYQNYYYGNSYGGYPGYGSSGVSCTQPVLTQPPAGCNYACAADENGCQRCRLQCNSAVNYAPCNCPTVYDPVCTRDNRTYDNACYAVCNGREVWYDGSCR